MKLKKSTVSKFEKDVLARFPQEACGLVVDGNYIPVPNSSPEPTSTFRIDPLHLVKASAMGEVQAVLHSHPYDKAKRQKYPPEWASQEDMVHWLANPIPWGIVATDGEGISPFYWLEDDRAKPLVGREWVHATADCYALVRDWFWQERGVDLPNYARGLGWWDRDGPGMIEENFRAAGFTPITADKVTVGDCLLMRYGTRIPAHCGVVVSTNEVLHHLYNRLSGTSSLAKLASVTVRYLRYTGAQP